MENNYSHIKVIGFDLDQTLYPKSLEIDEVIQRYIYEKIVQHKNVSFEKAKKLFCDIYKSGNGLSGRKTLIELGIPHASEIIQEALENADIASALESNHATNLLLEKLKALYHNIDIVTGSNYQQTRRKLAALSIPTELFNHIIADEDASKSDGEAYHLWMSHYKQFNPYNFLYIGDRESLDHEVPSRLGIQTILVNVSTKNSLRNVPQLKQLTDIENLLT